MSTTTSDGRFCFVHWRDWDEHVTAECYDGIDVGHQSPDAPDHTGAAMAMSMAIAAQRARQTREEAAGL